MSFGIDVLVNVLGRVDQSKRTIVDAARYIEENKQHYIDIVRTWAGLFSKVDEQTKIHLLFVINEVFQRSTDGNLIEEFKKILPACFLEMNDSTGKGLTVLQMWGQRNIFSQSYIEVLLNNLNTKSTYIDTPSERGFTPDRDQYDPLRNVRDLMQKIEEDIDREMYLRERVSRIGEDIITGRFLEERFLRNFDEASEILKEYEDILYYSAKTRQNLDYILQNLISDNSRSLDEIERKFREAQAKRRAVENAKLSFLSREVKTKDEYLRNYSYEGSQRYTELRGPVIDDREVRYLETSPFRGERSRHEIKRERSQDSRKELSSYDRRMENEKYYSRLRERSPHEKRRERSIDKSPINRKERSYSHSKSKQSHDKSERSQAKDYKSPKGATKSTSREEDDYKNNKRSWNETTVDNSWSNASSGWDPTPSWDEQENSKKSTNERDNPSHNIEEGEKESNNFGQSTAEISENKNIQKDEDWSTKKIKTNDDDGW